MNRFQLHPTRMDRVELEIDLRSDSFESLSYSTDTREALETPPMPARPCEKEAFLRCASTPP